MDFEELWVARYRPHTLDDILLSDKNRKFFETLAKQEKKTIPHLLFHGPVGTGKTSLAKIIIEDVLKCEYLYLNGSEQSSIETVRGVITNFIETKSFDGQMKVVLLDEADGLSGSGGNGTSAQKALRGILEDYQQYCRFIFTCNYNHQIIEAIWSRVMDFYFVPERKAFVQRCLTILKKENITVASENTGPLLTLINKCYPDMRIALNELQKASITDNFDPPENWDKEATSIAKNCFDMMVKKTSMTVLRKYVIDNEQKFMGDYGVLLKSLFEEIYNSKLEGNKKRNALLMVSEALYYTQIVLDREINFFATCIKLGTVVV